ARIGQRRADGIAKHRQAFIGQAKDHRRHRPPPARTKIAPVAGEQRLDFRLVEGHVVLSCPNILGGELRRQPQEGADSPLSVPSASFSWLWEIMSTPGEPDVPRPNFPKEEEMR